MLDSFLFSSTKITKILFTKKIYFPVFDAFALLKRYVLCAHRTHFFSPKNHFAYRKPKKDTRFFIMKISIFANVKCN